MELDQLQAFVTVCKTRSVTAAAGRLNTTPPSISVKIKALEEKLGIILFERKPKGMELTSHGARLQVKAEKVLEAVQNLEHTALEMHDQLSGTLNIGLNAPAGLLRVGSVSENMCRVAPGVELNFENTDSGKIIQGLSQKNIDAGYIFGSSPVPGIRVEKLRKANLVVCAPDKWKDQISQGDWEAMAGLPWLYSEHYCPFLEITDRLFSQKGLRHVKVNAPQTNAEDAKSELIGHGFGLALMEENEAREALRKGKISILPTEPIYCDLNLAFLDDRSQEPLMKVLINAVREAWGRDNGPASDFPTPGGDMPCPQE